MKNHLLALGLGVGLVLASSPLSLAVKPAPINQHADVAWSTVVNSPFDGRVVYDKHFGDGFAFVSSWSKQSIQATYTQYWSELVGYKTVWRTRTFYVDGKKRQESYPVQEPVYQQRSRNQVPRALMFAINNQVYTYEGGEVSAELATALASAPAGNMTIRLVWQNGEVLEMVVGSQTVAAWKTIFSESAPN